MEIVKVFQEGGITMYPLLILSIMTLAVTFERSLFWFKVLKVEQEIVNRILDAARRDWNMASEMARQAYEQPVGRFLYSALQLQDPDPELFRLALEASADEEIAGMRKGNKLLEAVIAMSPLLGLLGTVLGLYQTLKNVTVGVLETAEGQKAAGGIGESLVSTAAGLGVALLSLAIYRILQTLTLKQATVFRRAGNELELLQRQKWQYDRSPNPSSLSGSGLTPIDRDPINPIITQAFTPGE